RILESRLPLLLGIAGSIVGGLIARLVYSSGDTGGAYGRTSQTGTAQTWLNVSTNLETTSEYSPVVFHTAPSGILTGCGVNKSRKTTCLAGNFLIGSLTRATPMPAATKASAVAAPSASLTMRGLNPAG